MRFRIKQLVFVIVVVSVPLTYISYQKNEVVKAWNRQEKLVALLRQSDAVVRYRERTDHIPAVLRPLCDSRVFQVVDAVDADSRRLPYTVLEQLVSFESVRILTLKHTLLDDVLLQRLGTLPYLKVLYVFDTNVTRQGVSAFRMSHSNTVLVNEDLLYVAPAIE